MASACVWVYRIFPLAGQQSCGDVLSNPTDHARVGSCRVGIALSSDHQARVHRELRLHCCGTGNSGRLGVVSLSFLIMRVRQWHQDRRVLFRRQWGAGPRQRKLPAHRSASYRGGPPAGHPPARSAASPNLACLLRWRRARGRPAACIQRIWKP